MKKTIMVLLLTAGASWGAVPQVEWSVDSQKPAATWTLTAFAGATPLVRVDLLQNGEAWYPSSDWSGILWYGTNSDWNATSIVSVAGTFATSNSYIDFQCGSNTFGSNGTFYGGITMTNTTQTFEWGRGTLTVKNSGGISASGILDLRGSGVSVSGGLLTKTVQVIGLTTAAVQTAAASLTNGLAPVTITNTLGTASTNMTGDFATAAQGTLAGTALQADGSVAMSGNLNAGVGNITNISSVQWNTVNVGGLDRGGAIWQDASVWKAGDKTGYGGLLWSWNGPHNGANSPMLMYQVLDMQGTNISNLAEPLAAQDAATKNYVETYAHPQTNSLCWTYALPTTNWGPMVTAASTITRITAQAYSGGMTANVYAKHWTNGWGNLTLLGTMPCIAASSQSNFSWSVPVDSMIGVTFPNGSTQEVVFSVDVLQ